MIGRQQGGRTRAERTPAELTAAAVPGAGRVGGTTAAAIVRVDSAEHDRRVGAGLRGGVPDLDVLDAMMCLPLGVEVSVEDIERRYLDPLRRAPADSVEWTQDWGCAPRVRRLLVRPATVDLVIIRAATWRTGARRAGAFAPFATRVVLLTRRHTAAAVADVAWEADMFGIGLWVLDDAGVPAEVVPPEPFVRRYVKPAGWRFAEHAYHAWAAHAETEGVDR